MLLFYNLVYMLLQSILQELDSELTRLQELRRLVADLSRTPAVVAKVTVPQQESSVLLDAPTPVPLRQSRLRRDPNLPREPRGPRKRSEPNPRAFAKTIPSSPVVVTPQELAQKAEARAKRNERREREATPESASMAQEDLDALSRSLAARWSTGLVQ